MNVASIILIMLNLTAAMSIKPSIHSQPTVSGRNESNASSSLPNESHKKKNTTKLHTYNM